MLGLQTELERNSLVIVKEPNKSTIGILHYCDNISDCITGVLETEVEVLLVTEYDKPGEYLHLSSINIYEEEKYKGYHRQAVSQFEIFSKNTYHKAVTVCVPSQMLQIYKDLGYKQLGYLPSIEMYFMIKEFSTEI